ncbi:MAG: NADP-dependent isocitrate dehydrogenase [Anaerolineae bacterium]|nr:NADP-dependent isocitrate dehydrogenase [Anaerolineae bacterium]
MTTPQDRIQFHQGRLSVPKIPTIPFLEGEGCGPDIWRATRRILDAAVAAAYSGERRIGWLEVYSGEKALRMLGSELPAETVAAFQDYTVGIKGPLGTPVGTGIRSLNVALRQMLDLYACVRPVRYFPGAPSPMCQAAAVDMVVFRENTEDVYAGIEFELGSAENQRLLALLEAEFPAAYRRIAFPNTTALGIKPISKEGSQRLVRAAIRYALQNGRQRVTLLHKGNIMKFTEGGFRKWGYELAEAEFGGQVYTKTRWAQTAKAQGDSAADVEQTAALAAGRLLVDDMIADAAFEGTLARPASFDVLAAPNLIGDFLSDALAAQVGGLGIAPGANINYETGAAIFEATHGTAPLLAGKDAANPCSLILSGEMLLRYLGWNEAADLVIGALTRTLADGIMTQDFASQVAGAVGVTTTQFADAFISRITG